jgi:gliding motility-associated-like protein
VNACIPYFGVSGKLNITNNGLYVDSMQANLGCDSLVYIQFTSLQSSSNILVKSCDSLVSPSKKYIYKQSGLYQDTLKNIFNCDSIITIQLGIEPLVIALTKSNNITCDSPFAQLDVEGGSIYNWWPQLGLSDAKIANPIASPEKSLWYYVLVQTEIGCEATDSLELLVNKDPQEQEITNVFTPNNDGKNDCFPISGIAQFLEVEIVIFNRWGNKVFESKNPNACWDGHAQNGEKATEGTYFYILQGESICNQRVQLHGNITLIR